MVWHVPVAHTATGRNTYVVMVYIVMADIVMVPVAHTATGRNTEGAAEDSFGLASDGAHLFRPQ